MIDSGEITLAKLNEGVKIELMNQVEGDIVGVDILFKDGIYSYSAIANKPSTLFKVSITNFQAILSHKKATSLELVKYLCSLISEMEKRG